ncbi:hypothetical protein ACFY8C_28875 [Streptomyces flavochromogenes]|uniref:Uncharacterized protein n=1 Tax=Streptomyces flavochromogenes TaxID=68199 RepID=A0ABW6XXT3_9ACTN
MDLETVEGRFRLIPAACDRSAAAGVILTTPPVDGEKYTSTLTPLLSHRPRHPAV